MTAAALYMPIDKRCWHYLVKERIYLSMLMPAVAVLILTTCHTMHHCVHLQSNIDAVLACTNIYMMTDMVSVLQCLCMRLCMQKCRITSCMFN